MSLRKRRKAPFDAPGRATAWGMAGCLLLIPTAAWGLRWALAVTVFTALGGCYKGH